MERLEAIVTGRVQGVNFRYYTQREAEQLGLRGLVRNHADGSVEVQAEGQRAALEQLLQWLRRGPPMARVDNVSAQWMTSSGGFERFEVKP